MSNYSRAFLDQVLFASDIVALISEDTLLKGRGDQFMGLCPFPEHNEKTPSFSVSASKQVYYCFGCQNSGNIFTYLQKQRGMSFSDAVEELARQKGISIPKKSSYSFKTSSPVPDFLKLSEEVGQFYEQKLKQAPASVLSYLQKRGWTKELVQQFRLGYAPNKNALLSFLKTSEKKQQALELGLLNHSSSMEFYDNFRHRLIFPIISVRRQIVGFGARTLDNAFPKYINSKDSAIFHKGQILYGLSESARYLRQESSAIIVEGYTDFLSLYKEGFKNLTATLGTALTNHQAQLIKRYAERAILVFDGDPAGLRASERSLPILLSAGLRVKFLEIPKGQDPDEFIRSNGKEAFQSLLLSAKDLFFFVLQKKHEEIKSKGRDLLSLIQEIAPLLAITQNKTLQAIYKQRLLDLFGSDRGLAEKALKAKLKAPLKQPPLKKSLELAPPLKKGFCLSTALEAERLLLILCMESEVFLNSFRDQNGLSLLNTQGMQDLFKKIEDHYRQSHTGFDKLVHLVMDEISDPHSAFKSSYPIFNSVSQEGQEKIFQNCMDFLKRRQKQSEANILLAKMKMETKEDMHGLERVFQLTKQRLK